MVVVSYTCQTTYISKLNINLLTVNMAIKPERKPPVYVPLLMLLVINLYYLLWHKSTVALRVIIYVTNPAYVVSFVLLISLLFHINCISVCYLVFVLCVFYSVNHTFYMYRLFNINHTI